MVVRIRFARGRKVELKRRKNRRLALAMAALLIPVALMACVLGVWGLSADLKITEAFAISSGLLSHWQVWIASAVVLFFVARMLERYGRAEATPPAIEPRVKMSPEMERPPHEGLRRAGVPPPQVEELQRSSDRLS